MLNSVQKNEGGVLLKNYLGLLAQGRSHLVSRTHGPLSTQGNHHGFERAGCNGTNQQLFFCSVYKDMFIEIFDPRKNDI